MNSWICRCMNEWMNSPVYKLSTEAIELWSLCRAIVCFCINFRLAPLLSWKPAPLSSWAHIDSLQDLLAAASTRGTPTLPHCEGPHTEPRGPPAYQHAVIHSAQQERAASITTCSFWWWQFTTSTRHGDEKDLLRNHVLTLINIDSFCREANNRW